MARSYVARVVRKAFQSDEWAQEAVRRGLFRMRSYARWLIRHHGWKYTQESVVSALRRMGLDGGKK